MIIWCQSTLFSEFYLSWKVLSGNEIKVHINKIAIINILITNLCNFCKYVEFQSYIRGFCSLINMKLRMLYELLNKLYTNLQFIL